MFHFGFDIKVEEKQQFEQIIVKYLYSYVRYNYFSDVSSNPG